MAQKFNPNDKISPEELAKHLRQPEGETGKQVGEFMNKGNEHICRSAYELLYPTNGEFILEIGMGNGFFVKELLTMGDNLRYIGVDFSATMVKEAKKMNQELVMVEKATFYEASIEKLPLAENAFDAITTTNTVYFWPQPDANAKELYRVLKPGGRVLIAYRPKDLMEKLEVTQHGFDIYNKEDVEALLQNAGFNNISTQTRTEPELEFEGKAYSMEGLYTVAYK